jgi:hypothetical protein
MTHGRKTSGSRTRVGISGGETQREKFVLLNAMATNVDFSRQYGLIRA